ncbi:MAG: beta-galactosidase trimerization domain-containing protein [Candidatus Pacebacteria bacterium]|nr:beta-galactosidase trimerization domain-containing protein [Candidatus Paceibacterota bacterium]
MNRFRTRTLTAILTVLSLCTVAKGWDFKPLELPDIPVNGTDRTETPAALKGYYKFGNRSANKLVEHADTIALSDTVDAIETKHIDWAASYSGDPIRVLWLAVPKYELRGAVEIEQRSNVEVTYLMLPASLYVHPDDDAMASYFAKQYDTILSREYDVIVLRHYIPRVFRTDKLHPTIAPVFKRIEEKVENGSGLICLLGNTRWYRGPDGGNYSIPEDNKAYSALSPVYYGDGGMGKITEVPTRTDVSHPVSDGISFAAWPVCGITESTSDADADVLASAGGHPVVATGSYGKGRVAGLHFAIDRMGAMGLVPDYDTEKYPTFGDSHEAVYAVWLRAIAWAANQSPQVRLQMADLTPCDAGTVPRVKVQLSRSPEAPQDLTVRYRLTDAFGDRLFESTMPVTLKEAPLTVTPELPALHANGRYRMDVWLVKDGKTYNWGTAAIDVQGGPNLQIKRLSNDVRPGDTLEFQVATNGVNGDLWVLGVDGLDRVFVDQTVPVTDGNTVSVDTALSALPANRIFFTLRARGEKTVIARQAVKVYLPRIGLDSLDDRFCIASYGRTHQPEYLLPYTGLLYRAAGFNSIYFNNHSRERMQDAADEGLLSIGGKSWQFPQKGFSKVHKWTPNNPENRAKLKTLIARDTADFKALGAISRVLDDESWFAYTGIHDGELKGAQLSQDPGSIKLFREEMQKKYGDIAALNDMWGTEFTSFDEVRVIEEDEIKGKDNPSGWLEFREYMNWTYAVRYYGWVSEQHEMTLGDDFRAGCGAPYWRTSEGGPTYRGGDMSNMQGHMRFMMLYGGGSPGGAFAGQPGGQKYDPPMVWKDFGAWTHILTGADALWYYFGNAIIGSELAWRRHAEWIQDGIGDIIRGCGPLLSGAERTHDGIRVLSTSENQHMGWLFAKRSDGWNGLRLSGGSPTSQRTFGALMDNMFIATASTSEESIQNGELKDCKLLFLPQQLNMADATGEAIKEYVRNGGTVVADIMPATRHQMGKPRANSALAEVFGVDFSNATIHRESESWYSVGIKSPEDAAHRFSNNHIWLPGQTTFLGLKPTTAVAHAQVLSKEGNPTSGCFINEYGKGKAMLLNFVYRELNETTLDWHRLFGDALAKWAGFEASARIVHPVTWAPLPLRPLHKYERGKATLLASLRGYVTKSGGTPILMDRSRISSLSDDAMFVWTGKQHAYNVREGKYLGYGESATIDLPSFQGRLLCLLPYKVEKIVLAAPKQAKAGTTVTLEATIQTNGEAPGEHIVYFDITSPTGARRPLYCKTRIAPGGKATLTIPFAVNDQPGQWTVRVNDVMTGVATAQHIVLQ